MSRSRLTTLMRFRGRGSRRSYSRIRGLRRNETTRAAHVTGAVYRINHTTATRGLQTRRGAVSDQRIILIGIRAGIGQSVRIDVGRAHHDIDAAAVLRGLQEHAFVVVARIGSVTSGRPTGAGEHVAQVGV